MLRLYFLDLEGRPAACALCFENADTLYLYNSGYDRQFAALSVGQVCTILTIKEGIAGGLKCYNFLKGDEVYKKRLGGKPVGLVRLRLSKA
jgi:CelD/BcsL family acetyltransferase involved in cellulose biosynthesis